MPAASATRSALERASFTARAAASLRAASESAVDSWKPPSDIPQDDPRLLLAPGSVCGVVVRNIVVDHRPLYALGDWAAPYDPALLGLSPGDAPSLNDDRVGRCLDRLFDADRASLLTETVLHVVRTFGIDCSELHNDSTTVTVTGGHYDEAGPPVRGGVKAPARRARAGCRCQAHETRCPSGRGSTRVLSDQVAPRPEGYRACGLGRTRRQRPPRLACR